MPRPTHLKDKVDTLKGKRAVSSTMVAYVVLCELLCKGEPKTRVQLQEMTGLTNNTVLAMIRLLRKRHLIHVAKFVRPTGLGNWAEAFAWGTEVDAVKPKPMTEKEYTARYRIRKRLGTTSPRSPGTAPGRSVTTPELPE